MNYTGGLGWAAFGRKGRGQCTQTIHTSLQARGLSSSSSKTQHLGHKTSQICHLSSSELVQAEPYITGKDGLRAGEGRAKPPLSLHRVTLI